jgi:preprotein translocase subunit SecA
MEAIESGRELDAQAAVRAISQNTGQEIDASGLDDLYGRPLERAVMDRVIVVAQVNVRLRTLSQALRRSGITWTPSQTLLTETDEQVVLGTILQSVDQALREGMSRTAKEIAAEIQARIRRPSDCTAGGILRFLENVRFGTRTQFDDQHRRVSQKKERLIYTPWVAEQISGWDRHRLEQAILEHLQSALRAWEDAWGLLEMQRISAYPLADLDDETRAGLEKLLGGERFSELKETPVSELPADIALSVRGYLGQQVMFNVQRQLMLDITSRYWVEHLTAMEVLRQGIGLQSYAQKDPLAEYKVRAYDMFQDLLSAIQSDVVTAMFTYRPRDLSQVRVSVERRRRIAEAEAAVAGDRSSGRQGSKRRRKRRKKR